MKLHVPYFSASRAAGDGPKTVLSNACKCESRDFSGSCCFPVKTPVCFLILPSLRSDIMLKGNQPCNNHEGRKTWESGTGHRTGIPAMPALGCPWRGEMSSDVLEPAQPGRRYLQPGRMLTDTLRNDILLWDGRSHKKQKDTSEASKNRSIGELLWK